MLQYRVKLEVEYLIFFLEKTQLAALTSSEKKSLRRIYECFSEPAAVRIKELEKKCQHDVKAVEYFLQEELGKNSLGHLKQYIHFGLTSEDTNSCAYGMMLHAAISQVLIPQCLAVLEALLSFAQETAHTAMLARTHGQPAVPTTLGKEVVVFATRLEKAVTALQAVQLEAKLSGAVGNWSAHQAVLPSYDWMAFSQEFIEKLGLRANQVSTQIVPAESYSECFQALVRVNAIVIDCARDMWQYISDEYLLQRVVEEEVGSSTMPQKVNPVEFENSEGNAGLAIAVLQHCIEKLPISRLQRDLSDSTVKRSIGTAFGYTYLALSSLQRGLEKLQPNTPHIKAQLDKHPEVLSEAAQTALRLSGNSQAYELLRDMTRGKEVGRDDLLVLAEHITDDKLRQSFAQLQPSTYLGNAGLIVTKEVIRITQAVSRLRKG